MFLIYLIPYQTISKRDLGFIRDKKLNMSSQKDAMIRRADTETLERTQEGVGRNIYQRKYQKEAIAYNV